MKKKTYFISIIILILICITIITLGLYYFNFGKSETKVELDLFIEIARNETSCSDLRNELFLIDNNIVFWVVEGSCSDASYSYTLFGENPKKVLCKLFDSIAGPQQICNNEEYQKIFGIMKNNISKYNFGLDDLYKITQFF
jgi:hypothetical protein